MVRGGGIFNGVENIGLIGCNIGKNVTVGNANHKKKFPNNTPNGNS
jgi:hypothetical protein